MAASKSSISALKHQQGLALLVLVIALVLTISTYYFSTISIVEIRAENTQKTMSVLNAAKHDLLAYAMNYPDTDSGLNNPEQGPGNFPCPDDNLDGVSDTAVGVVTPGCGSFGAGTMGRLPWATIQTENYIDADGELLWYAVSSNFANQANQEINSTTIGGITVESNDGQTNNEIIAVIFSPGKALVRDDGVVQKRSTASERDDPRNYLDIASGEDNASFFNNTSDGFIEGEIRNLANDIIVNDLMVVITYEDLMPLVRAKVENEMNNLLNNYLNACKAYPEASAFDPTKTTYNSEDLIAPAELREGHLPLGIAKPFNWGDVLCVAGTAPMPAEWLSAEGWDKTTYYSYAFDSTLLGSEKVCGSSTGPACLTIENTDPLVDNAQAIIIASGRELVFQDRLTAPINVSDYFEGENNDLDETYDANEIEDYIWVITP